MVSSSFKTFSQTLPLISSISATPFLALPPPSGTPSSSASSATSPRLFPCLSLHTLFLCHSDLRLVHPPPVFQNAGTPRRESPHHDPSDFPSANEKGFLNRSQLSPRFPDNNPNVPWEFTDVNKQKAICKEYNQEVRAAQDLLNSKRQGMDPIQSTMKRLNNTISIGDIDGKGNLIGPFARSIIKKLGLRYKHKWWLLAGCQGFHTRFGFSCKFSDLVHLCWDYGVPVCALVSFFYVILDCGIEFPFPLSLSVVPERPNFFCP